MRTVLAIILAGGVLAGCNTPGGPMYASPLVPIAPEERGEFCRLYAAQTQRNAAYNYGSDDGRGSAFSIWQARRIAETAYRRCLAGQTG